MVDPRSQITPCTRSKGFPQPPLFVPEVVVVRLGLHKKLCLPILGQNESQTLGSLWGTGMSVDCFLCSEIDV